MNGQIQKSGLKALLVALALLGPASAAHAFSFLGITLFEDQADRDAEAVIADPQNYTLAVLVTGNGALTAAVRDASRLAENEGRPASGAAGLLAMARADYRRIVAALYAEGYYGGAVNILFDGKEADGLAPDTTLADPASVAIKVDTGPQFRFGQLRIENGTEMRVTTAEALSEAGFVPGEVARSGAIRAAAIAATLAWKQKGYPKAEVSNQDITADHNRKIVDVVLTVTPGRQAVIGAVSVDGAKDMDAGYVARQTGLEPGKLYSPGDIKKARERLAALDVFNVIKIEEAEAVNPDGTLPITIIVSERAPRRIGVGATFSSTDGLGTEAFWLHRNLFGQAEQLRLDAKIAGIAYPIATADFDYFFGGTFTKPGIWTPETDLVASASVERTVYPLYAELSAGARIGVTQEFNDEIKGAFGVAAKQARFFDTTYGIRDFTTFSLYSELEFDNRDNELDATEGFFAKANVTPFYEAHYGNVGLQAIVEGRAYVHFDPEARFVLAARAKAGAIIGPNLAETPPDMLFFAGGGGSVRGYGYKAIGVPGPGGTVTGGKFLTEASVEARFRATEDIGLVGFVDAGYVTAEEFRGLAEGTRLGAGIGLRYNTGFGPLRLDFAVPLAKRAGDPNYAIYAGIGQAF